MNKYLVKIALSKTETDLEDAMHDSPNHPTNTILLSSLGGAVAGGVAGSKLGRVGSIGGAVGGASVAGRVASKYLYTPEKRQADKEYQQAARNKYHKYIAKKRG